MKLKKWSFTARRAASLLCALALTVSVCAAAGTGRQTVRAKLWDGFPMYVDEIPIAVADENNLWRYPLLANGTFYIPLQTASEFLGADFTWDGKTAALTVTGDPVYRHHYRDQPESTDEEDQILLQERDEGALLTLCPDVVVTLDGKPVTFTTVSGASSYPGICRDVLYLPLRGVAELCGKEITYLPPIQGDPRAAGNSVTDFSLLSQPVLKRNSREELFLYDAPTKAQLDAAQAYLDQAIQLLYDGPVAALGEFLANPGMTDQEATAIMRRISTGCNQFYSIHVPDVPFLKTWFQAIQTGFRDIQWQSNDFIQDFARKLQYATSRENTVSIILTERIYSVRFCHADAQRMLDVVRAQAGL